MKPVSKPDAHEIYQRLIDAAKAAGSVTTAVAHPCDEVSLKGAVEAARQHLISPILVGPTARIREIATQHKIDISGLRTVDALHSHDSAAKAVELARNGEAEALMKGSLHTNEIMGAVVAREGEIRTSRRISHCFIMDVPGHPDPLIITDAAVNIALTLEEKVDIVQNAIDLANALHLPEARVAVLSAIETVNPKVQSEAASLSKMAERGQLQAASLTDRWRLTMQSMRRPRRPKKFRRPLQAEPMCSSCLISRRAICSPKASRFSRAPTAPASCSAREFRSF
jgi:phosphate acetyltransferase